MTSKASPESMNVSSSVAAPQLCPPSAEEAKHYYEGLPSRPTLLGRASCQSKPWPGRSLVQYLAPIKDSRRAGPVNGKKRAHL
ncbi:unnamed protein product [Sympodiomycopsis kandeliae]